MSATLAYPYRGFAITYSHHDLDKVNNHEDMLVYNHSQPCANRSPEGFAPEGPHLSSIAPYPPTRPAALSHPDDEPQPVLMESQQMRSREISGQYHHSSTFELSPLRDTQERSWSANADNSSHHMGHRVGHQPSSQQTLLNYGSSPPISSSEMLYPVPSDHSPTHPPDYSLSLPQPHHHHCLPQQASIRYGVDPRVGSPSPSLPGPAPNVVGQPGMPIPASRPRGPKLKFTREEDILLVELKEIKNLTWKQIADFFPGRTSGTLQVRYCTKLKTKDVIWTEDMVCLFWHSSLHWAIMLTRHRCTGFSVLSTSMRMTSGASLLAKLGTGIPLQRVARRLRN
ncbi:Myb-like transcription factor [Penicillium lagena]|uniref:Myb-like transcription factor n=1 Tax=Penicillium lagena TaxID=94218 RepID=UPI002540C7EC|nr:Myb-like transcription factor [Penicillium lagena]KAJ5601947.1 Myb-like transcription factor [Penicillium lagena]